MIEIPTNKSQAVRPLISDEPPGFLIALAALENISSRIFVDNASNPNCALLLSPTAWHTALGNFDTETAQEASQIFRSPDSLSYLQAHDIHLARLAMIGHPFEIHGAEPDSIRDREMRILIAENTSSTDEITDPRIVDLSLDTYHQAAAFTPMLSKFWPDPTELIEKRMAKVFIENEKTKGICYSCFCSGNIHEPHITIDEEYRGTGIGKQLTIAYTNSIRTRGQRIFWSHYTENIGSGRCAAAAGFVPYGTIKVAQYFKSKT